MYITRNDQYNVYPFMVMPKEMGGLELKGNELLVYAVIYQYSQNSSKWARLPVKHLAELCGCSKQCVQKCLKSLLDEGLILRKEPSRLAPPFINYRPAIMTHHNDNE